MANQYTIYQPYNSGFPDIGSEVELEAVIMFSIENGDPEIIKIHLRTVKTRTDVGELPPFLVDQFLSDDDFFYALRAEAKAIDEFARDQDADYRREEIKLTRPSVYNTIGARHV